MDFSVFKNEEHAEALAAHLSITSQDEVDELVETGDEHYGLPVFDYDGEQFAVGTGDEANDAKREAVQEYIDECVLPEIPKQYRQYFDDSAFTNDCTNDELVGLIGSYDGCELVQKTKCRYYYIYQLS